MLGTAVGHLRHEEALAPRHLKDDVRVLQVVEPLDPLEYVRTQYRGPHLTFIAGVDGWYQQLTDRQHCTSSSADIRGWGQTTVTLFVNHSSP